MKGNAIYFLKRFQRIPQRIFTEINFLRIKRLLRVTPTEELLPIPGRVGISTSTICNANCVFCGYQFVEKSRKKIMTNEVFLETIEKCNSIGVENVDLTPTVGDPLVDSEILQRIEILRSKGIKKIAFSTNGIAINDIGADALISRGPDAIHISTCGFDRDEFKSVYRSDRYDDVISGIEKLLKENSKQKNRRGITISVISTYPQKVVLGQVDAVHLLELGANISFTDGLDNWNGIVKNDNLPRNLRAQIRKFNRRKGPCHSLYNGPVVYPDGNVSACHSRDINQCPDLCLGNILKDDLSIMHQKTVDIINQWDSGSIPEICKVCKVYSEPHLSILPVVERYLRNEK